MLAILVAVGVVAFTIWYLSYLRGHRREHATLPLPIGMYIPYIGCAPLMALRPNTIAQELARTHGDVYTLYFMGRYITVVNQLAFHPTFFRLDFYSALKDLELEAVMGPHSIEFRADDTMRLMRKRLTPRFLEKSPALEREMLRALEVEALHRHEVVDDVFPMLMRVLLCMNTVLFLGERMVHHPGLQALMADFHDCAKAVIKTPGPFGYFARRRCHRVRQQIVDLIKDEIVYLREYPAWLEAEDDISQCFLQDMMRTFGDDPEWTDDMFAEKVFGILYATIANTPLVAVNTLMFILLDGDVRERVQQEVIVAYRIGDGRMTPQALSSLQLMGWCIEESLRLVSVPIQARRTPSATPIPGTDYVIPEGRVVALIPAIFHLDPSVFPDPGSFCPERFREMPGLGGGSAPSSPRSPRSGDSSPRMSTAPLASTLSSRRRSQAHDSKVLSWGRGTHKCLGQELAYIEIRMVLAQLLHKYRVNLPADRPSVDPIELLTTGVSMFRNRKVLFKSKLDLTMNLQVFQQSVLRRNKSVDKKDADGGDISGSGAAVHNNADQPRPVLRRIKTAAIAQSVVPTAELSPSRA